MRYYAYFKHNCDGIWTYKAKTTFHIQVREDEMEEMLSRIKRYYLSALVNEEDLEKRLRKTVSGKHYFFKGCG